MDNAKEIEIMKEIGKLLNCSNPISFDYLYDLLPDYEPVDIRNAVYGLEERQYVKVDENFKVWNARMKK